MPYQLQDLQNRLNRLRQDLNNITQAAAQLQQAEQQAQSQLARISQQESFNSQQLQRIYQLSINLQNEVNAISSAAQQFNVPAAPYSAGQFGTAGYTPTTSIPYTGTFNVPYTGATSYAAGAHNIPFTGVTGTANISPSAYAVSRPALDDPRFNPSFPTGASAGAVYGGAQAYRPWPDNT